MEAAVTFVGFAASLVTLVAVVGDSAQTVHTLWSNFRDSPINLKRLSHAIAENEALIKDMQAVSDAYERVGIPESLLSRWKATYTCVIDDFRELNMEMSKILECTKGSEITKKHLRRRVRHFFSEKLLEYRCQQMSTHKADMSYIHLLMHSSYTIQIGEKLQSFGQMIETLRQENLTKLEGLQNSLETNQADLVQAVQSELGRFTNPGAIDQAFHMITDEAHARRNISRTGVKKSKSPFHCSNIINSQNLGHHRSSGLVHAVEWHSHRFRFVIGTLEMEHVESVDVEMKEGDDASVQLVSCRSKKIRFIFEPPPWFSGLIMKIDIAMQIARHGCTPSITWGPVPVGRHLEPLVDELHQISNLTLDRRLLAIAEIGELDSLFEEVVSYCLGISYSSGKLSQKQRDVRPIADALEQGRISPPGGDVGSRFLTKIIIRIEGIKNSEAPGGDQSRADMRQPLSKASIIESDGILLDRARGYLSETQRAIMLSSSLIDAGAQLPPSVDFTSILLSDHGLWYLQSICPTFDITEIEGLSQLNQWVFACLVRTVPACYESVSRQLQGFPINALQFYTSAERLTVEINSSHEYLRHRFVLSLSAGGSTSMLEPLLFHGLSMGDLSTYYLEKATKRGLGRGRGRMEVVHLLSNYGASLSLETSTTLLEYTKSELNTLLRDPSKSEIFCRFLVRALGSCGPLQEIDDEHAIFGRLVLIFQRALLQSKWRHVNYSRPSSDDCTCNKVVRLLLEAGLFRDSKLPARYWSFPDCVEQSPLTLAIHVRNVYAIRLLLKNGYDVDEVHHHSTLFFCAEARGTPLTYAVWLGYTEAVTILLEAGADVTKIGAQGQTAPEMAKKCVSLLNAGKYMGCAKDMSFEDWENEACSRHRIFTIVCADLKERHGMEYEDLIAAVHRGYFPGSCLRFAEHHPRPPRYWRRIKVYCAFCPEEMLSSQFKFAWDGFLRKTYECPCLDCQGWIFGSNHSPLPESWERLVAPCKCSFVENSTCGFEKTYMHSNGSRLYMPCPSRQSQPCKVRVLYINHITGEATLNCPCATCSPDRKGVPCIALESLFGEDEPGLPEQNIDPLIPAQDLTKVGNRCWRLGDLFNEDREEGLDLEDDTVIPAQDVGLHIFDDMPGFALARNHIASTAQDTPLVARVPKSHSPAAVPSDLGLPTSRTTAISLVSLFSLFVSYTVTRSTRSTDDPRLLSLRELTEALVGLVLSTLLVIVYECASAYTYIKDLPAPPPFLSKLVVLVLLTLGLRILTRNFGLV